MLEATERGLATRRHARALLLEVRATRLLNRLRLLRGGLGHLSCRRRCRSRWLTTTRRLLAPGGTLRRIFLEAAQGGLAARRHARAVRLVICAARLLNRLLLRHGLSHPGGSWRRGDRRWCRTARQRLLASRGGVRRVLLEAVECRLTTRRRARAGRLVICAARVLDRGHLLLAGLLRHHQTGQSCDRTGEQHL